MKPQYSIDQLSPDTFQINQDGFFLLKFTRKKMRLQLEEFAERYARSSKWIGAMVRMVNSKFPSTIQPHSDSHLYDDIRQADRFKKALQERGFRVFKTSGDTEEEMISFLRSRGFTVEGDLRASPYTIAGTAFSIN